jgi:septum site-determining protein MinD
LHLGSPIVPIALNQVISNKAKVEEAIYEHESGLKILPASLAIAESSSADHEKLADIAKKLKKIADHVILDASAGLGEEARSALKAADDVVVITNPEISAVTDALKTIKIAEEMNKRILGVVITRYEGKKWEMDIPTIKDMLEVPILGIVPEDDAIKESQRLKNGVVILFPRSQAAKAYRKIARKIAGGYSRKFDQPEENERKDGFFLRLFRKLGLS